MTPYISIHSPKSGLTPSQPVFLPRAASSTVIPSMTADNNITVVPHSTRTPSATVSSPVTGCTRSAVHPSCPTANSADGRGIDEDKVERLVWEYFNHQMAAAKSEKVSDGAPVTQPTLGEDDDLTGEARISLAQSWINCMKDAIEKFQPP